VGYLFWQNNDSGMFREGTVVMYSEGVIWVDGARPALSQIVVLFYALFVLCRSVHCLCVNVYCTTATRFQPNCS